MDPQQKANDTPHISVVMPVYNGETYLREALDSILTQTYTDFEVLAVNDGSTDGSSAILHEAAERDPRVRVLDQENRGLVASLNRGCQEARAPLIARMDDDDLSHPERFQQQVEVFEREAETVLVSCNLQIINAEGEHGKIYDAATDADLASWFLMFYNYVGGHSQTMFRRSEALEAGFYAPADPDKAEYGQQAEDYALWCRLAQRGTVRILPQALQSYRFHSGSVSRKNRAEQMYYTAVVAQRHIEHMLGKAPPLNEIEALQHFWLDGNAQSFKFPEVGALGTLDANLRWMMEAYLKTPEGQALTPDAVRRLKQRIADRYTKWAFKLPLRSREARAVLARAARWDPKRMPSILKRLSRRALNR